MRSGCVVLARTPKIIWHSHRGYTFFEYFVVIKSFVFSMTWEFFLSELQIDHHGDRLSRGSNIHLEINGEIFTISPNVNSSCVTLARNTDINWRKDRFCGFPEYFVVTKNFIFR